MKSKKFIAALCALAVVVSSSGGLPFSGLRLFDTAVTASAADFEGDGSETSPYLINSANDWNTLANDVNNGTSYSGKYFKLNADITISTMIGKNNHGGSGDASAIPKPFSGTFDGGGHVITLDINSTSTHGAAPFSGVTNATIKNLIVDGKVLGGIHSSGLVGVPSGTLTVENVTVNAEISGQSHLGGIVGHSFAADVRLTDCSFGGKVLGTSFSGGLVGWGGPNGKLTATRCSFSGEYTGAFHPVGFIYGSGTAVVTDFYTTKTATSTQNSFTYLGGLTQNQVTVTDPTAITGIISDGNEHELIVKGSTTSGTLEYSLDGQNYSEAIPKAVDAGDYRVWYRVNLGTTYISENYIDVTVLHSHAFTYIAVGDTITAECSSDCDITAGLTLTISAPTDLKADGSPKEATLSTGYNTTAFPDTYTIEYYKGDTKLDGAPSAGGHYTAKVTVGEATASVDFTIVVDPTYTITIPATVDLKSSDPVNITASGVTLNEGQKIVVTLDGASNTTSGNVFNAMNDDSVVTYKINGGNVGLGDNNTVAEFTDNGPAGLSFAVDSTDGIKLAGAHTETLTFGVKLETEDTSPALAGIKEEGAVFELDFTETAGNKFVYKVENKGTSGFVCTSVTQNDEDETGMFGEFVSATLSGDVFEFKYSLNGYKYDEYSFNINEDSYTFTDVFKTEMTAIKLNDKDVTAKLNKIT